MDTRDDFEASHGEVSRGEVAHGDEDSSTSDRQTAPRSTADPHVSSPWTIDRPMQIGIALVVVGVVSFLGNFGVWHAVGSVVRAAAFVVAGVVAVRFYRDEPGRTWTLPVGAAACGLGVASLASWDAGVTFLASIGVGFAMVYLANRARWWALMPAGVVSTLAVVASLDATRFAEGGWLGATFFLGLGGTFALVAATGAGGRAWAWWPAGGALVVAILQIGRVGGWVVPAASIVAGAWLLLRQSGLRDSAVPRDPSTPR